MGSTARRLRLQARDARLPINSGGAERKRTLHGRQSSLLVMAFLLATVAQAWTQAPTGKANERSLVSDFNQRVHSYLELRERVSGKAASVSDSPQAIVAREKALAENIRIARKDAKQGEIFPPPIAQYFRQQLAAAFRGPQGKKILASLRHAEPVKLTLAVNESYPEEVPLQSTPPSLLLHLPPLPEGLEYRILGRQLVLRDRDANLVVDYIPRALGDGLEQ